MEKTVSTALRAFLQLQQYLGKPAQILPNSTLNQKLVIQESTLPTSSEVPRLSLLVIGRGGHRLVTGADNISYNVPYQHSPKDNALFNQFPFVLRKVGNDLTATERAKYRLRRQETWNGEVYIAYYGRVLDLTNVTPALELRTVDANGNTSSTPYVPTLADLSPTPTVIATGETYTTSGDYIAASARIDFSITAADVLELIAAANIKYNQPLAAIISEMALCSGVDRVVTATIGGTQVQYTESIATQVMSHISTYFPAPDWTSGAKYTFDVGNVEPLLTLVPGG